MVFNPGDKGDPKNKITSCLPEMERLFCVLLLLKWFIPYHQMLSLFHYACFVLRVFSGLKCNTLFMFNVLGSNAPVRVAIDGRGRWALVGNLEPNSGQILSPPPCNNAVPTLHGLVAHFV